MKVKICITKEDAVDRISNEIIGIFIVAILILFIMSLFLVLFQ